MSKRQPDRAGRRRSGDARRRAQASSRRSRRFASSRAATCTCRTTAAIAAYADVGRPYVVWNVVAAPEFSVEPKEWCYPIVGCVAYRGYFVERRARGSRTSLAAQGARCERRRGGRLFDPGPFRRSHPEYHDRLERRRAGVDHLPRAHASDDLHAERCRFQRSARDHGRGGGRAPLAREPWPVSRISSATSSRNSGPSRS